MKAKDSEAGNDLIGAKERDRVGGTKERKAINREVKGDVWKTKVTCYAYKFLRKRGVSVNSSLPGTGSSFQYKFRPLRTKKRAFPESSGF